MTRSLSRQVSRKLPPAGICSLFFRNAQHQVDPGRCRSTCVYSSGVESVALRLVGRSENPAQPLMSRMMVGKSPSSLSSILILYMVAPSIAQTCVM